MSEFEFSKQDWAELIPQDDDWRKKLANALPQIMQQYMGGQQALQAQDAQNIFQQQQEEYKVLSTLLIKRIDDRKVLENKRDILVNDLNQQGYSSKYLEARSPNNINKTNNSINVVGSGTESLSAYLEDANNEIDTINNDITNIQTEIANFQQGKTAANLHESNFQPGLQSQELTSYYESIGPEAKKLIENSKSFLAGTTKTDPSVMAKLDKDSKINQQTKTVPLSFNVVSLKSTKESYIDPTYNLGANIQKNYANKSNAELSAIVASPLITYDDLSITQFDYSDLEAIKMQGKIDAVEVAVSNAIDIGLDPINDVKEAQIFYNTGGEEGSLTVAYKQYEQNYLTNLNTGINDNVNYRLRDKQAMDKARMTEHSVLATDYQDGIKAYEKAPSDLRNMLFKITKASTQGPSILEQRVATEDIHKALKQRGVTISKDVIETTLSTLETATANEIPMLLTSDNVRQILSLFPNGTNWMKTYTKQTLKAKSASLKSDYTPTTKQGQDVFQNLTNKFNQF